MAQANNSYEVEEVIGHKFDQKTTELIYSVKWAGVSIFLFLSKKI